MVLTDQQSEFLAHFQSIANIDNVDECIRILEAHNWNLNDAVNTVLSGGSAPQGYSSDFSPVSASSSRPRNVDAPRERGGGEIVQADGSGVNWTASLPAPVRLGVNAVSSIFSVGFNIVRFIGSYLPAPIQNVISAVTNPGGQPQPSSGSFVLTLEREYGRIHPPLLECTYGEALEQAKREFKFLLVYLHSEVHMNTPKFCRETLCTETFSEFVASNFLMWAGSISASDAYQLSNSLRASTYPFLAVIGYIQNQMKLVATIEGPKTTDELMSDMVQVLEHWGPHLDASRIENEERDRDRLLREEQDREYYESLAADQERERKAREDAERAEQERLAAEREEAARAAKLEERRIARTRKQERLARLPEPVKSVPGATQILIRLPDGTRLSRRFNASDKLELLFDYVDCQDIGMDEFALASNFPRRTFTYAKDGDTSLEAAGLQGQSSLFVQEL